MVDVAPSDPPGTKWLRGQTNQIANQQIQNPGPAAEIPYGPVLGRLNLLPNFNDLGPIRPFGQGEYLTMTNGSITSDKYTIDREQHWEDNPGQTMSQPSLWRRRNAPVGPSQSR